MRQFFFRLPVAFTLVLCLLLLPYLYRRNYAPAVPASPFKHLTSSGQLSECGYAHSVFPVAEKKQVHRYARGIIRPRWALQPEEDLVKFDSPFLESFDVMDGKVFPQDGALHGLDTCANSKPVVVDVVRDPPTELTAPILIGMATKVARIEKTFASLHSELAGTKTSIIALVEDRKDLSKVQKSMRKRGLDITLYPTTLDFRLSYFSLARTFDEHIKRHRPDTKWVIWADDDSYFPSLRLLGQHLSQLDHTQDHFIGTLSEKAHHNRDFGRFPYGGAGVVVSLPVVQAVDHNHDYCMGPEVLPKNRDNFGGDRHLSNCLKKVKPELNMTVTTLLRQFDVHGCPAGIYEDGNRILSFHHWTPGSWAPTPVVEMSAVKSVAGEDSIRHRYVFGEKFIRSQETNSEVREYFVLTNGYSIVRYQVQANASDINFNEREATWWEAITSNEFNDYIDQLGPLRLADVPGVEKKRWHLEEVKIVKGNVHQLYIWTKPKVEHKSKDDSKDDKGKDKDKQKEKQKGGKEKKKPQPEDWIEIIWLQPQE